MYQKFISNVIKGFAHASAGGGIAIGAGAINLTDVDAITIVAVVIAATFYNMIREAIKNFTR